MSHSPTPTPTLVEKYPSPSKSTMLPLSRTETETIVDGDAPVNQSEKGKVEGGQGGATEETVLVEGNILSRMSSARKNLLLVIFSSAMFLDAAGVSAIFILTAPISSDLNVSLADSAWILTSYSLAFASFLLLAGRLADLFPPHLVFVFGFIGLGVLNLIISFMTNSYAFFILRAISGIAAVQTIPSAINMVVQMYTDPTEQAAKLALFGLSGALANVLGLVLAGVFLLASWRWYFRFVAIIALPLGFLAFWLLPKTESVATKMPGTDKLKRLDPLGVLLMVSFTALLIYSFTSAGTNGYNTAGFIAPFLISWLSLAAFFVWEMRLPEGFSLLPKGIFGLPNILPLTILGLICFMWFATIQLRMATYFQEILGYSAILTAARIVPMGITALFAGGLTQAFPKIITHPRYPILASAILAFGGTILFIYSYGGKGIDYWKFVFTGEVIGTAGVLVAFLVANVRYIQAFPIEFAGVGGSVAQIVFQVGAVIGISVQTGLDQTGTGLADWKGTQAGFWFAGACALSAGIAFAVMWRQPKESARTDALESGGPHGLNLELAAEEMGV